MKLKTSTQGISGSLTVPADKSISHRAIMFGALANGTTTISNFLRSEDCFSTLHAFEALGVAIDDDGETITVEGVGMSGLQQANAPINIGNSGTTIRLMTGILAGQNLSATLYGDDSLDKRPMGRVMDPLRLMGAKIVGNYTTEFPPLTIDGTFGLRPLHYQLPVASAQVKSALIFAALQAYGTSTIIEKAPTRNHTEQMIQQFGGEITTDALTITVSGPQTFTGKHVTVPGDISSAAFFLVAAAITPNSALTLKNVGINPTRTGILDVLQAMGVNVTLTNVDKKNQAADMTLATSTLKATTIAGKLIPRLIDELPVIALLATQAQGTTVISDAEELKVKETNRIDATASELNALGANIEPTADGLIIHGPTPLHGGAVDSHGDHRIGMMLQIAALIAEGPVDLARPEAVAISYPNFFADIEKLIEV